MWHQEWEVRKSWTLRYVTRFLQNLNSKSNPKRPTTTWRTMFGSPISQKTNIGHIISSPHQFFFGKVVSADLITTLRYRMPWILRRVRDVYSYTINNNEKWIHERLYQTKMIGQLITSIDFPNNVSPSVFKRLPTNVWIFSSKSDRIIATVSAVAL